MFGVRLREERHAVGWAGLQPLSGTDEIEVGYAFGQPAWGRGYATEVASAVVQWGFEALALERIVAVASPENAGSRRVMDKLGMRYEGMRLGLRPGQRVLLAHAGRRSHVPHPFAPSRAERRLRLRAPASATRRRHSGDRGT